MVKGAGIPVGGVSNPVWKEEHFSLRIQSMEEAAYIHGVSGVS